MVNALKQKLSDANIPDSDFEFKCMLEQITGDRFRRTLTAEQEQALTAMIQKRISGEPLQYLLGEWEFYGMRVFVGHGVLIPRPETECLIDLLLDWIQKHPVKHIIDLCTGSACIALALKKHLPDIKISAVEYSSEALAYAQKNISYHKLAIDLIQGDVLDSATACCFQNIDLIISNPPYLTYQEMQELQTEVRHEPFSALSGGADGLYYYQQIPAIWKSALHPGGLLAFEIGSQQGTAVSQILKAHDFAHIQIIQDLEHRDRIVTGLKK